AAKVTEPKLAATDVPGIVKALKSDPDAKVRTQAALALAARPKEAAAALPDLEAAVKDPSPYVREAAARAIGAQGPAAAHAIPALVAACKEPGQAGAVTRSCLYALGAMGNAAAPAMPELRTLTDPSATWVMEKLERDVLQEKP